MLVCKPNPLIGLDKWLKHYANDPSRERCVFNMYMSQKSEFSLQKDQLSKGKVTAS